MPSSSFRPDKASDADHPVICLNYFIMILECPRSLLTYSSHFTLESSACFCCNSLEHSCVKRLLKAVDFSYAMFGKAKFTADVSLTVVIVVRYDYYCPLSCNSCLIIVCKHISCTRKRTLRVGFTVGICKCSLSLSVHLAPFHNYYDCCLFYGF